MRKMVQEKVHLGITCETVDYASKRISKIKLINLPLRSLAYTRKLLSNVPSPWLRLEGKEAKVLLWVSDTQSYSQEAHIPITYHTCWYTVGTGEPYGKYIIIGRKKRLRTEGVCGRTLRT